MNAEYGREMINVSNVVDHLEALALFAAKKQGVRIVSAGLTQDRDGRMLLAFEGDGDKLHKLEAQFTGLAEYFQEERLSKITAIYPLAASDHQLLLVDVAPLLDVPDVLASIAAVESRRSALRKMAAGTLVSFAGTIVHADAVFNGRPFNVMLAELLGGSALEIAGGLEVRRAADNFDRPSDYYRFKNIPDYFDLHSNLLGQVFTYYFQKGIPMVAGVSRGA